MAGLHGVVGANAQHGAGVATRPVGHHNHTRPLVPLNPPQVFLGELKHDMDKNWGKKRFLDIKT